MENSWQKTFIAFSEDSHSVEDEEGVLFHQQNNESNE